MVSGKRQIVNRAEVGAEVTKVAEIATIMRIKFIAVAKSLGNQLRMKDVDCIVSRMLTWGLEVRST